MKKHLIRLTYDTKKGGIATVMSTMSDEVFKEFNLVALAAHALAKQVREDNPKLELGRLREYRYFGVEDEVQVV